VSWPARRASGSAGRLQAQLELQRSAVLDGHDARHAGRLDLKVGEGDRREAGELDGVAAEPVRVMSASRSAAVMRSSSISAVPVTSAVRPTASATPMLANSSRTR
jgi:hypothetical protein